MKITEVRLFPTESKDGKLKAFATMTFDDWFVVRNVKIIQGNNGLFVAMPSRKAMDSCPKCHFKNVVGSKYCNQCGGQLSQPPPQEAGRESQASHMDIAHPITQECRVYIQEQVLAAYNKEAGADKAPEKEKKADPEIKEAPAEEIKEIPAEEVKEAPAEEAVPPPVEEAAEEKAEESAEPEPGNSIVEDNKDIEL